MNERDVKNLIDSQLPKLKSLPITLPEHQGSDNYLFRLGDDYALRIPRKPSANLSLENEIKWQPLIAKHSPLGVPKILTTGALEDGTGFHWCLVSWLAGETPTVRVLAHPQILIQLIEFMIAIHSVPTVGGPSPSQRNSFRGEPLQDRNDRTIAAIKAISEEFSLNLLMQAWSDALDAPVCDKSTWIHGDLYPANMLVHNNKLKIIDFGLMGVGDPACDLSVAWTAFDQSQRYSLKDAMRVKSLCSADDWRRARGWAVSIAAIQLEYYGPLKHPLASTARETLNQIMLDANCY